MRTTPEDIDQSPELPVLDTLRAVGALAVLTTHTSFQTGGYGRHGTWGPLTARFDVGVAVFFVLSGFLLARPHLARAAAGLPRPSTGRYYWKRLVRVYPVYVVTAVLALALVPENDGSGPLLWTRTLLLANAYTAGRLPQGLTQMWSLGVEVAFYALLPALMLAGLGRGRPPMRARLGSLLGLLVALTCWWHLQLATAVGHLTPGAPLVWLPAYLTWFAVGIALAWAHVALQGSTRPPRLLRSLTALAAMPGACWAMVLGLMLVAATPLAGPTLLVAGTPGQSLSKSLLYAAVGGLVVLTGVFAPAGSRYAAVLSAPALRHLGHLSYCVFCIHLPVLRLVFALTGYDTFRGHGLQVWALTLLLSLAAAERLHRLVERPAMRLRSLGRTGTAGEANSAAQTTTTR